MTNQVCVFGSFVVDLMTRSTNLPLPKETLRGSHFQMGPGGKGFNQGIAAKKLGANVISITKLGKDTFSKIALDALDQVGLTKDYIFFDENVPTGTALIMVDEVTGQNQIVVVPSACETINDQDIEKAKPIIQSSSYLLLQFEINQDANEKVKDIANQSGCKVIVNPAPYKEVDISFYNGLYLVTPNDVEASQFSNIHVVDQSSMDQIAKKYFDAGVENVIITLGDQGVYFNDQTTSEIIPAHKVNVLDTTGAGDAFNGGLLTALSEDKSLKEAVVFANAVAALSTEKLGTTISMPTREEVDSFLDSHP